MHEFGTTTEQLAEIAVTTRRHAGLNPSAKFREPITVEDVLASRIVSSPLHLLDCCIITDGGGAVVVTSASARAICASGRCVILGGAEALRHTEAGQARPDRHGGAPVGPARACQRAGIRTPTSTCA